MDSTTPTNIESLVPSKKAYFLAWISLVIAGIAAGFIGVAMMQIFFPSSSDLIAFVGTLIITGLIVFTLSILTSLALQASLEWKARSNKPINKRPSKLI